MVPHPDTPDDEDALRWDGDDEPRATLPAGWVAKGKGADLVVGAEESKEDAAADVAGDDEPVPPGNATLIGLGMLGGVYLLYTIGWIVGGFRLQGQSQSLVTDAMFQASFWLAVAAPVIWFGTTFLLTRGRAPWLRFVWLAAGAVLLVPWPFVMTGAVGA